MPFTIDEEAAKKQLQLNVMRPQEVVRQDGGTLREGFSGTMSGGLPVKQIPYLEYPRAVFMHPNEPYVEIKHKNTRHEIVSTEFVATEHQTKIVNNEGELKAALAQGWVKEPYIPEAPPKENADLYGPKKKAK